MKLRSIAARPILDSRGHWTIEVEMTLRSGVRVRASAPQGKSTGSSEVRALPAAQAVAQVKKISAKLLRQDFHDQASFDKFLNALDGTALKTKLGGNTILALSIAFARAEAHVENVPLWQYLRGIARVPVKAPRGVVRPRLFMNMVNGGLHAGNNLDFQEYLFIPNAKTIRESVDIGTAFYAELGMTLARAKGKGALNVGDEGGYAPNFTDNIEPFRIMRAVAKKMHLKDHDFSFGLDAAATDIKGMKADELTAFYSKLIRDYEPLYLEDPFNENAFELFTPLTAKAGSAMWIAGDDLTTTNVKRMERAHAEGSVNAVIIKPNQIGSVTEALDAVRAARAYGWAVVASHRSGETNDDFIADFAYGVQADGLKLGAPARGERTAKYNRLLEIESSTR